MTDYCLKCWTEFTTMTNEELESWNKYKEFRKKGNVVLHSINYRKGEKVYCEETKKTYKNMCQASKETGVNRMSIRRQCLGIHDKKYAKSKYTFKFVERKENE